MCTVVNVKNAGVYVVNVFSSIFPISDTDMVSFPTKTTSFPNVKCAMCLVQ